MTKPFKPPTMAEAKAFATSIGYKTFNVDKWWNFYESKNWMIGKNKMQKWKSAVWTWFTDTYEYREMKREKQQTARQIERDREDYTDYIKGASEDTLADMRTSKSHEHIRWLIDELRPEIKRNRQVAALKKG